MVWVTHQPNTQKMYNNDKYCNHNPPTFKNNYLCQNSCKTSLNQNTKFGPNPKFTKELKISTKHKNFVLPETQKLAFPNSKIMLTLTSNFRTPKFELTETQNLILPKPQILFYNQHRNLAGTPYFDMSNLNFGLLPHNVWKAPKYDLHSIDHVACLEEACHIEQSHKSPSHMSSHLVGCTHCWKYVGIDGTYKTLMMMLSLMAIAKHWWWCCHWWQRCHRC